ncbi:MAG: amino acid adenylation domain-containing protein [Acidobacteria bacterium]|nr:amino acid adenylation domain-containing protein [Acidobacteriota bacterium]MCL5288116.1 amino acid adenylation domain-containing protein [Acidobacteriota bacterium]
MTVPSNELHLAAYLEASAQRFPERTAVVSPDGSSITYRQLNEQADRVAAFLVRRGVQPGDRVGLLLPKSKEGVTAIFGILKARAAYVPADYTAPATRLRAIYADCQVRAIFIHASVLAVLAEAPPEARPDTIVVLGCSAADARAQGLDAVVDWEEVLSEQSRVDTSTSRSLDDLAFILYTSGSTGIPKGVMLSQRNATSLAEWASSVYQPSQEDRFSNHPPFHFDMSVQDLYPAIKHAAALYLVSEELGKDPRQLALFISENRLTIWYSTPSILTMLAEYGNLRKVSLDSLRIVGFAGEVFPVKHLRKLVDLVPHPAYYNFYGPTETNVCTFASIPKPVPANRTEPFPIGPACYHCTPLVLDQNGAEVNPGEEGLLYISGPSVFLGYWNRPKENAAAFLERNGRRWYNTGDVVREDKELGFIYLGRRDRMVKRRGFRIELDDVQSGLYRHKGLREVAVIAVPDADSGVKIIAYLSAHDPAKKPSIIELKTFCNQELPYYMSPDVFIYLDALPRTSTDKVNFPALKAAFLEGK